MTSLRGANYTRMVFVVCRVEVWRQEYGGRHGGTQAEEIPLPHRFAAGALDFPSASQVHMPSVPFP